jgi:hypothetical protein
LAQVVFRESELVLSVTDRFMRLSQNVQLPFPNKSLSSDSATPVNHRLQREHLNFAKMKLA